jgi:hypothetical protein
MENVGVFGHGRPERNWLLNVGGGRVEGQTLPDGGGEQMLVSGRLGWFRSCVHALTDACLTRVQI